MNGSLRWIAAAAAIILIAVVGFAVLGRPTDSGVGTQPSPSPSPRLTAGPTASAAAFPPDLFGAWIGETRQVPGNTVPQDRSWFLLADEGLGPRIEYLTGSSGILGADISAPEPGKLTFTSWDDTAGCAPGDAGSYQWSVSPGGQWLTLTQDGDDACPARAAALPGTWTRSACPNSDLQCLGDLEPGTYRSVFFNPLDPPGQSWVMDDGQMQYTVPDGWSNSAEGQGDDIGRYLQLWPQGGDGSKAVFMRSDVVAHSQDDGCPTAALGGIDRTPRAMADWLASLPGLVTTAPEAVTIDGYEGLVLDLAMDPSWTRTCPYSEGSPMVPLFTRVDPTPEGFDWGISGEGRMRIYLLDLGDGRLFWADIEAPDEASFQALLPEATSIVESIDFGTATP